MALRLRFHRAEGSLRYRLSLLLFDRSKLCLATAGYCGSHRFRRPCSVCETRRDSLGVQTLQLDTSRHLIEAQTLYLRNGYKEIPAYNDNPYADHWFEKRL